MSSTQPTMQQVHLAAHSLYVIVSDLFIISLVVGFFVCLILFLCSLHKTMRCVPSNKRVFPNWFIWMMLIPFLRCIFTWLMLPFGIPHGLRNMVVNNKDALRQTAHLKIFGLANAISLPVIIFWQFVLKNSGLLVSGTMVFLSVVLYFVSIIIYWIKIVSFRKKYLEAIKSSEEMK